MADFVQTRVDSGVGRLTLNRPDKRNALTRQFIEEIHGAIKQLRRESSLRVLVLQGSGSVFCAGMDLSEMQQRAKSADGKQQWQRDSEVYCDLLVDLFSLSVPTVAVLQGPALAGGLGIVLACDMIIASDNAFFILPEPMRGIVAAMVTPFLIRRIGAAHATYLLLSGERVSAEMALRMGICNDVVSADRLEDRAEKLVASILTGSVSALAMTKQHIERCWPVDLVEQVKMSVHISAEARETDDAREGLAAFLEKRKPNWQP